MTRRTTTRAGSGTPSTTGGPRSSSGRRRADEGRHGDPLRPRARPRDHRQVRRPQRGGARGRDGGLVVDMSAMRGVEVDPRTRIARANGGALPRRARHRRPGARTRLPDRRRRPHRRRRADARRRRRPPAAALRPHDRQPDRGRARHRRRPARPRDRDRGARAVLGPARRRLELRDRDGVRVPAPAVRAGPPPRRPDLPGDARSRTLWSRLPRVRADGARRRVDASSASIGPGRTPATRTTGRASRSSTSPGTTAARPTTSSATRPAFASGPTADHDDDRQRAVSRRPDRPRPRVRLGQPLVHQEPQRERRPAARRSTSWSSSSRPRRGRRPSRSPPWAARSAGSPRTRRRTPAAPPAFDLSADSSWTDPTLDDANVEWCRRAMADRRAGSSPRRLRERQRRRRPGGVPPDLRRREARAPGDPQARVGPRQRVPREPERGAGRGVTTRLDRVGDAA